MDKQTKILLLIISIAVLAVVLLYLLLSGYDISEIRVGKGFHLG